MKQKELRELSELETMPRDLKVKMFLALVDKAMRKANLTWKDITKELLGKDCLICGSRIRSDSKGHPCSLGTRSCIICNEDLEKIEIEPSLR